MGFWQGWGGMSELHLEGDPRITVELRRRDGSRRLSLRVSRLDGRVTMSLPRWTAKGEAMEFAREKETWIRAQLAQTSERIVPHAGGGLLFEGHQIQIAAVPKGPVRIENGGLLVPGSPEQIPPRIGAFLKETARARLVLACDHYANMLDVRYERISLRDTRSRWGSCTSAGNLMFSWRLVMAPVEVLDYVAAHEVAHLLEMNHSRAYWHNVERVFPGYNEPRRWLRVNAARLHAYQFRN